MSKYYKKGDEPMKDDDREDLMSIKMVEKAIIEKMDEFKGEVTKAQEEAEIAGTVSKETTAAMEGISEGVGKLADRVQELEQRGTAPDNTSEIMDLGAEFIKSEQWGDMERGRTGTARIEVKTAIINATGQNQPLVQSDRLQGVNTLPNRNLRIRDVLPSSTTNSNLVEFVRENAFTNSAGPQVGGSPEAFENVTKPESAITFTLVNQPVQTLAHWIPASKQILSDAPGLQAFISGRLTYGLKLYEETQLLLGDNANGELNGLHTQATAFTVASPTQTNELDIIRAAIRQAHVAEYTPDTLVLNPADWYDIEVKKVGSSATDIRYVVGNPREMMGPTLWGLPVVVTNSITSGQFLLGSFRMGAEIKDREMATVEVSRENSDNFVKNMVTVLAEERIALIVYRTEAFIKGAL